MSGLKLSALDAEDLDVISAAVQDALVAVRDCAYFKDEKRFVLLLNRFRWEADPSVESAHSRTHSALVFNEVTAVRHHDIPLGQPDRMWPTVRTGRLVNRVAVGSTPSRTSLSPSIRPALALSTISAVEYRRLVGTPIVLGPAAAAVGAAGVGVWAKAYPEARIRAAARRLHV